MQGNARDGNARKFLFVCLLGLLLAGCFNTNTADGPLDTSRLPRVTGAKEVFASAATTIFTSPDSIAETAEAVAKALAEGGWQSYVAPFTARSNDPSMRTMSLKKGPQAVSVSILLAPAQGNATSVTYTAVALAQNLPFTKDARNVEYDPNRPLLTLVTGASVDNTLDFYRQELGTLGWSLLYPWISKPVGQAAVNATVKTANGAYAYYAHENQDPLLLVLQRSDDGGTKVELKRASADDLASASKQSKPADALELSLLPRLEGAQLDPAPASSDRLVYTVPGSVAETIAATKILFAANGWKQYVPPLDDPGSTTIWFKKGPQGLLVFFTMAGGQATGSSVNYVANRVITDLPFPDAATDFVFNDRRPYLSCIATGTIDTNLDFFLKELGASGWSPLSATGAARWPNANINAKIENGALAYYIRENQLPILLFLQRREDGKIKVEIKVAPFAQPQELENGQEVAGLPTPKGTISSSGYGGSNSTLRKVYAAVPAEVSTVLAFYRRELSKLNWKEETQGAVLNPDEVALAFSSPEETAVLKLGHQYDLTTINLVAQVRESAVADRARAQKEASDKFLKEAEETARAAIAASEAKRNAVTQASKGEEAPLRPLAEKVAPILLPETAENIEFDGADGKLEFNSASSVKALAAFYRAAMKQQGWQEQSSVINTATMVELNFSKSGKELSFTIMQLGGKANVTANGSALIAVTAKPAAPEPAQTGKTEPANTSAQVAEQDLEAELSGGLPVPTRHTMTASEQSPFRREVTASVPADLAAVLAFYRRELGKLNWKEETKGAVVAADRVVIAFSSPDGPAVLKLGRKDGETSVNLAVRNPDAANKAGIMPKPGQAKLLFGNVLPVEAAITINNKTIKVAAGAGSKGPDGPTLDVAPGKYKFSIKMPAMPAQNDEIEVGADETWGLLIGPGGALPMHVY